MSIEDRWKQRFQNFEKAYNSLIESIEALENEPQNQFIQDSLILRCEYTFELAWKTLKDILEFEGFEVKSPRATIKQAFQTGYIADGTGWLDFLEKRNLMTHTYDEETSKEVVDLINGKYFTLFQDLYKTLNDKIAE